MKLWKSRKRTCVDFVSELIPDPDLVDQVDAQGFMVDGDDFMMQNQNISGEGGNKEQQLGHAGGSSSSSSSSSGDAMAAGAAGCGTGGASESDAKKSVKPMSNKQKEAIAVGIYIGERGGLVDEEEVPEEVMQYLREEFKLI